MISNADTVGPDGWRIRFAPTNLGSLLESEQGRALWQPGNAPQPSRRPAQGQMPPHVGKRTADC